MREGEREREGGRDRRERIDEYLNPAVVGKLYYTAPDSPWC